MRPRSVPPKALPEKVSHERKRAQGRRLSMLPLAATIVAMRASPTTHASTSGLHTARSRYAAHPAWQLSLARREPGAPS